MKVTDIRAVAFDKPIFLLAGDTLKVTHHTADDNGNTLERVCAEHTSHETATWTHSILFKLNGNLHWMIGTQETIEWLESQQ